MAAKGVPVRFGGRNDAGSQGGVIKLLAAFWGVEVEGLDVFPGRLRSTRMERLVCFNFVRKGLVL